MTHELKTWPEFYDDIKDGIKTFEVRRNDRHFTVGDCLLLKEYAPSVGRYTGAEIKVTVTYVLPGGKFGIEKGFCVMGIKL